jgi:peptidyl-prolyl cis-trans isomerase C
MSVSHLRPVRALALLVVLNTNIAAATVAGETIARVNDAVISRKALDDLVEATLAVEERQPDAARLRQIRAAALDSLIGFELLYQAGIAGGIVVTEAEVDDEMARNKSRFPDDKSFAEALARKRMTPDDLRAETRRSMAVNRYLERSVWRDVAVTPESIAEFYRDHRRDFHRPEEVRASHILIRVDAGASDAERKAAWAKAVDILAQLNQGADFAATARKYSEDRATAARGGDLGFFASGTMVEAFEKPVFSLLPGRLTGVFETRYGFHIAKVTDRRLAGTRPLDDVRESIREHLTAIERQKRQTQHVAALRSRAEVEIYDPELAAAAK